MIDITNKKILLVRNDNIGDLICTTPAIEALRKKYPKNQIDIVVNSYNYTAIYNNPFVNRVYCYTKPKHANKFVNKVRALFGKIKIIKQITQQNYDVVVIFRGGYSKSAEIFSRITKAKHKIGVKNPKGKDNFTTHITSDNNVHEVEFCFKCLKLFGVKYNGEKTRYFINRDLVEKYNNYQSYILFHISSRVEKNQYSIKSFKKIINNLPYNNILITTDPQDIQNAVWLENNTKARHIITSSLNDLEG